VEEVSRHPRICNQKGGVGMNVPYIFANGLVCGIVLASFVFFMGRK